MDQSGSFDAFVNALKSNRPVGTVSVTGLVRVNGNGSGDGLQLAIDPGGTSWIDLPKELVGSIEATNGRQIVKDTAYPVVNAKLSPGESKCPVVGALFNLLSASGSSNSASMWHDNHREMTFDDFAKSQTSDAIVNTVAVRGWAKFDPQRPDEVQFSPTMNCNEWFPIPKSAIRSIQMLGSFPCEDHSHPIVGVSLQDPGKDNPGAHSLLAVLAQRQRATTSTPRTMTVSQRRFAAPGQATALFGGTCPNGDPMQQPGWVYPDQHNNPTDCILRPNGFYEALWQGPCGPPTLKLCRRLPLTATLRVTNNSAHINEANGLDQRPFNTVFPDTSLTATDLDHSIGHFTARGGVSTVEIDISGYAATDGHIKGLVRSDIVIDGESVNHVETNFDIPANGNTNIIQTLGFTPTVPFQTIVGVTISMTLANVPTP